MITHTHYWFATTSITGPDYGRDEDAVVKALKKHGGLEEEARATQSVVTALQKQAESLVSEDHFDSANKSTHIKV